MESRTDARKEKLDSTATWRLIQNAKAIYVAKGKKIEILTPHADSQETILKAVMGRSGNLRAPTIRVEDNFFVGFNSGLYENMSTVH